MLQLEIDTAPATLESVNLRTEKSGPERVPAADLKISCPQPADILAHFSPTLRGFLFDTEGPRDLADGVTVRDRHIAYPIARDEEMTGAALLIGFGLGDMRFEECRLNQIRLTPIDGGTVVLQLRAQCRPSPEQVAKLYQLQGLGISMTIEPAVLPVMKDAR